jgi:hypothetical protein
MKKFVTSSEDCSQEKQIKFVERFKKKKSISTFGKKLSQFQQHFPAKHKNTIVKENPRVHLNTKASQMPRVFREYLKI